VTAGPVASLTFGLISAGPRAAVTRIDFGRATWFPGPFLAPRRHVRTLAMTRRVSKTTSKTLAAAKGGATR
jgi:hypothetical protein